VFHVQGSDDFSIAACGNCPVSKKLRIILLVSCATAALLAAACGWAYLASREVPPFYSAALAQSSTNVHQASDALLRQTAALVSDFRRAGQWKALFTTEQINGWLADDLLHNHPTLLPSTISDPRVAIENDQLMIGFRWKQPQWNVVVWLAAEVYLREPNVIAVRIRKVRAGGLPLPLKSLLHDLIVSGRGMALQIDEQQIEGDPLLLITPPQDGDYGDVLVQLESLELHDGQLYVAGHTQRGTHALPPVAERPDRPTQPAGNSQTE
jgi:hypothetical protein